MRDRLGSHIWKRRLAAAAAAGLAGIGGAIGVSAATADGSGSNVITGGQTLTSGETIASPEGRYQLQMQTTGNLAEVMPSGGLTVWQSGTSGYPGADAVLQPDGDLVVDNTDGETLWSDNVPDPSGCPALNILDDGNVEVDGTSAPLWTTGEVSSMTDGAYLEPGQMIFSPNYDFYLEMDPDGDLALYNSAGTQLWNTNTGGNPGAFAVLQGDGNFVVYAPNGGSALWNAGTEPNPGDTLDVQSDGNVVIYPASGSYLWNSGTAGAATGNGGLAPTPQYGSAIPCPAPAVTTPTVTVTVPTTTVVTVSPPTTPTKRTTHKQLSVQVEYDWIWKGVDSYLKKITFGRLPSDLRWSATITPPRTTGTAPRTLRKTARTAAQRRRLLLWLEDRRYSEGETVAITLQRTGYLSESVTFHTRLHHVPSYVQIPRPSPKKSAK